MPINTNFQYDPPSGWLDSDEFPSQSSDEQAVRAMLQRLPDQIRNALNALAAAVRAENIPYVPSPSLENPIPSGSVQSALEYLMAQLGQAFEAIIPDGSVTEEKLASGAVTDTKLSSNAVGAINIKDGAVTSAKIGSKQVKTANLADGAVTAAKIGAGEITADKFNASVAGSTFASLDSHGKLLPSQRSMRRVTVSGSRTLTLDDAEAALYYNGAADIQITIPPSSEVSFPVGTEILVYRGGSSGAVNFLQGGGVGFVVSGESNKWLVPKRGTAVRLRYWGSNTWWLEGTPMAAGSLGTNCVTEEKIQDGAVSEGKLASSAVSAAKIATDAVTTAKIKDGNVTKAKLASAVQAVLDGAYQKPSGGIPAGDIATDAVTTAKIKDGNVTKDKLASAVQTVLDSAYQKPSGGIPATDLAALSKIVLTSAMYGTTFPSNPATGQLFFKKV